MIAPCLNHEMAATIIQAGGVVVYPTEAVYGLGCDPFNEQAVHRILQCKQREIKKGLIVLVSSWDVVEQYTQAIEDAKKEAVRETWPGACTWVFPNGSFPAWITGDHDGVALRMSAHPVASALCEAAGGCLVSTSANVATKPPIRCSDEAALFAATHADGLVGGNLGDLRNPTPIRDVESGLVWRA